MKWYSSEDRSNDTDIDIGGVVRQKITGFTPTSVYYIIYPRGSK